MDITCEMLLYPELLSNYQLIYIIQQRHLHIDNLERMARCELIEVFRNYCVPYGQRKHRDSGRSKVLNKARQFTPESAGKPNFHSFSQSYKSARSNCDRIKPPPDILSGHMKRIKLETVDIDNNSKRKMSIDSDTCKEEYPPIKKDRKKITWP